MTQLNRSLTLLLTLTAACGVDADPSMGTTEQGLEAVEAIEQVRCSRDACIVHDAQDTDGDGFADIDEVAAGTDPDDALSRPYVDDLLERIHYDRLPSFLDGHSMVIVLPTQGPDGRSVFGGREAMPSRRSTMDRLGLTSKLLDGIDTTQGLTLTNHGSRSHPRLGVRGARFGLVSKGAEGATVNYIGLQGGSQSAVSSTVVHYHITSGAYAFGSYSATHFDQTVDDVTYKTSPTTVDVQANHRWADEEEPYLTRHVTQTTDTTDSGDTSTTTTTTKSDTDGTTTVKTSTKTTEMTTTNSDGNSTTITEGTTTTTTTTDGKTTESTATWESCEGADCPTRDASKTECEASSTSCDTNTGTRSAYTSGEYDEWSPSPDMVRAVLAALGATIHTVNSPEGPTEITLDPMSKGNKYGPISLVLADDGDVPLVFHLPSDAQPETREDLVNNEIGGVESDPCTYCGQ